MLQMLIAYACGIQDHCILKGFPAPACRAQEELFAGLNCQPGFVCTRAELSQDLRSLLQSGLFANVDARVAHKGKGKYTLNFTFSENLWQPIKSFKVGSPASSSLVPA